MLFVVRVCAIAALGGLPFGYDTAVIAGAIGCLQEHFSLTAAMKGWAASSALLGRIIGVSIAGVISDYAGRKKTLIISAVLFLASAVGTAVAASLSGLVFYRILGGIGVGIASMASTCFCTTPRRFSSNSAPAKMQHCWRQSAAASAT